jgi:hypothetical protein
VLLTQTSHPVHSVGLVRAAFEVVCRRESSQVKVQAIIACPV